MTPSTEARALVYHRFKVFFFLSGIVYHLFALTVLAFSGLAGILLTAAGGNEPLYFCFLYLFLAVVSFPLDYASDYVLEKKFDLSKQSLGGWLADLAKKTLLSLAMFVLTSWAFFAAVRLWPEHWWIALAAGWFLLSAVLATVFPVIILPLFHKTRPLPDAVLKAELLAWCRSLGYRAMDIRELALSDKTVKANAALTGFGRTRRVIIGDTLLSGFTPDEIRMVLTHEIGHHAESHLLKGILLDLAVAVAAFGGLFWLAGPVSGWAGTETLSDVRALPALSLLAALAGLAWLPIRNAISRQHEREADRYAWWHFPSEPVFVSLMEKLAAKNLSHRTPARWEELLLATHPPIAKRIASARVHFSQRSC